MKKKALLTTAAALLVAAILFLPVPGGLYRDGGTREYTALTYKIVAWNRITNDDVYRATRVYWYPENLMDIDALWQEESQDVVGRFVATVVETGSGFALVEPAEGEAERFSSDRIYISLEGLEEIGAAVGSVVEISYTGGIMETYPAQVHAVKWALCETAEP